MPSLNRAEVIGHLGQDPDVRHTQTGKTVTMLTIATSEKWKDKQSGQDKEDTQWHRCVLWGVSAEKAGEWLSKGDLVRVEGKLVTRKWQDKDGNDRYTTEINVRDFMPLKTAGKSQQPQQSKGFDDDIPF